jgi:hypothetical protein
MATQKLASPIEESPVESTQSNTTALDALGMLIAPLARS